MTRPERTAPDDLRADVERVIAEHKWIPWIGACEGCNWRGFSTAHAAHVSERVMVMLAEEWGLVEERATARVRPNGSRSPVRLTTRWTTDDAAREGDEQ